MGTPDIAAGCLERLIAEKFNIVGVVTRTDKPKGRGHKTVPTEVKVVANAHNIPVFQPETLKNGELADVLAELAPDLIVVVAYGRILPKYVLDYPRLGCINMHASKLPKYRGAAPIQRAVINGDTETAATVMLMDEGLDTGDILAERILTIGENETAGELFDRMTKDGAELLCEVIPNIENITPVPQSGDTVYAEMITKEEAHIDWTKSSREICNLIRGMNPAPIAYTYYKGEAVKILKASAIDCEKGVSGEILDVSKAGMTVKTGDGAVIVSEIRFPGKKTMRVCDYIRGNDIELGVVLG
ncbi:MAG: methionyl-tRNA formyltransferase [Clostridia bacterium]|nr:methionyl-tRNA formyltransferase [Clostridia bacterium]